MELIAKLKNFMRTANDENLEEAEKKLKYGVEAQMHFHCKDERNCVLFIRDHPLDGQKRRQVGMSWNLATEKGSELTRFKIDKMLSEKIEDRLERERQLVFDQSVSQKIEQLRLSEGQNALNKRTKKMLQVGAQLQEKLDHI